VLVFSSVKAFGVTLEISSERWLIFITYFRVADIIACGIHATFYMICPPWEMQKQR
jgi:hypothetical protein